MAKKHSKSSIKEEKIILILFSWTLISQLIVDSMTLSTNIRNDETKFGWDHEY